MKTTKARIILNLTTLLAFLSVLFSCDGLRSDTEVYEGIALTKSEEAVRDATNEFSLKLFVQLAAGGQESLFFSPMGVTMLNCMLANGAQTETYQEIVRTLGLEGRSADEVNAYYKSMLKALTSADRKVSLSLANSLWTAQGFSAKSAYKNTLKIVYAADVYSLDFSKQSAVDKINDWSNSKTNGLIPQIIDRINGSTQMMLMNALYFKGEWTDKFLEEANQKGTFSCVDGTTSQAVYMNQLRKGGYADEEVSVCRIPYGNGAFYLEAILPAESAVFSDFVRSLTKEKLLRWGYDNLEAVNLFFPKMDIRYDTGDSRLTAALQALGMKQAFSSAADFSGISDSPLYVDVMRQKSVISVDEGGTVAASNGITALRGAPEIKEPVITPMRFNRPFVFLIRESSTGAILFMGTKVK